MKYPVVERNASVYIWHDEFGREPFFEVPDVFASFDDRTVDDYTRSSASTSPDWRCTRSACWRTGWTSPTSSTCTEPRSSPIFTWHDFDQPTSWRRLHHHVRG